MDDDFRREIEQLHEDSQLTGNLSDESARLVLAWAEARLKGGHQPGPRVREIVRQVNRLAGNVEPSNQPEFIRGLLSLLDMVLP